MKTGRFCAASFAWNLLCLALLLGCSQILAAQAGRGGISGLVSEASGAVVPGATVTATNTATGEKLSPVTTAAGLYSFISLPPSRYEVSAVHNGFDTVIEQNITVSVDQ